MQGSPLSTLDGEDRGCGPTREAAQGRDPAIGCELYATEADTNILIMQRLCQDCRLDTGGMSSFTRLFCIG